VPTESKLTGRAALVTGVSRQRGIGWAIVSRLLDQGAHVFASGWTPHDEDMDWGADPLPPVAERHSDRLVLLEADLDDADAAEDLVWQVVDQFGAIDIVVAAHAHSSHGDLFEVTADELDACWRINARASLLLTRAFAQAHDPERGDGRVLLFTSGQNEGPMDGEIAYAVSKGAIHQMTLSLSNAVADRGITVNTINPGPVDTGYATGEVHALVESGFPAGRWGQPSDIANVVSLLVSDDAGWITGQVINAEGGWRRWSLRSSGDEVASMPEAAESTSNSSASSTATEAPSVVPPAAPSAPAAHPWRTTVTDQNRFDVAVVGGGLIGSAAARHLAESGRSVVVIAAPEPPSWPTSEGPFASHYDASRITRIVDSDPIWAELAVRSIDRYFDIEQRSGIAFHDPRGLAWIDEDIDAQIENSHACGGDAREVTRDWLLATTGIRMPDSVGMRCLYEGAPAGVINPRQLAAAQLRLADQAGAVVIAAHATGLTQSTFGVQVNGSFASVDAGRVLIAAGAYGNDLIDADLGLDRQLRTTLRVDLGPAPEMPSLMLRPFPRAGFRSGYWNPPVRYPDGRVLLKFGCEVEDPPLAENAADIAQWFQSGGDQAEATALLETAREMLPAALIRSYDRVPCVITRTASDYPMIGWVDDRIAVAVGGNGSSAKSSDELGRLASTLFSDEGWNDDALSAELFAPPS